jgi:L,D-peptidoglycan transpeptidase YkuD (ErfK/YbiS/YcfS/YnhG family)
MRVSSRLGTGVVVALVAGSLAMPAATARDLMPAPGDLTPALDAASAAVAVRPPDAATLLTQRVPSWSAQAILVTGRARSAKRWVAISRWVRQADGSWAQVGDAVRGHIGARGWGKQWRGDYRTPIGTFTLTSAGGRLPAPEGTALPYDYRPRRYYKSTLFADYVVRINYNVPRSRWRSRPTNSRAIDFARGGGIWLHVDSSRGGPTAGCVSQPREDMAATLAWLDPTLRPVIVLAPGRTYVTLPGRPAPVPPVVEPPAPPADTPPVDPNAPPAEAPPTEPLPVETPAA